MLLPNRAKARPPARAAGAESIQNAQDDGLAPKPRREMTCEVRGKQEATTVHKSAIKRAAVRACASACGCGRCGMRCRSGAGMFEREGARSRARNKKLPRMPPGLQKALLVGVGNSMSTRKGTTNQRIRGVDEHHEPKSPAAVVSRASDAGGERANVEA